VRACVVACVYIGRNVIINIFVFFRMHNCCGPDRVGSDVSLERSGKLRWGGKGILEWFEDTESRYVILYHVFVLTEVYYYSCRFENIFAVIIISCVVKSSLVVFICLLVLMFGSVLPACTISALF